MARLLQLFRFCTLGMQRNAHRMALWDGGGILPPVYGKILWLNRKFSCGHFNNVKVSHSVFL